MYRTIVLSLSFFFSFSFCSAQVEQGTIILDGGFVANRASTGEDIELYNFALPTSFGYFINDNLGFGGSFIYGKTKQKYQKFPLPDISFNIEEERYRLSLFSRYYFDIEELRLYTHLDFKSLRSKLNVFENEVSSGSYESSIAVGGSQFLNSNVAIEGQTRFNFFSKSTSEYAESEWFEGPLDISIQLKPFWVERGDEPSNIANRYLTKGTKIVGGLFRFQHDLDTNVVVGFQPKFGYMFNKNIGAGAFAGLNYRNVNKNNPFSFSLAPFVRYYVHVSEGLQLVPNLMTTFEQEWVQQSTPQGRVEYLNRRYSVVPAIGLHVFLADALGLFANGSISFVSNTEEEDSPFNEVTTYILGLNIGLELYLE